MEDLSTSIIGIALVLALVFGTWWAANYAQQSIPVDPPRRVTHEANSWAKNFVMVRTDEKGIAINRLEGKYLQHFPDDDSYKITTAKAISQQPDTPITIGTSRTAIMNHDGSRVIMRGDAHVRRPGDRKSTRLNSSH